MRPRIEGGKDWLYLDITSFWAPVPEMPKEHLQSDFVYLSPNGSMDAVSISQKEGDIHITIYRSRMPGYPNVEVEYIGDVEPEPEKCPALSYKLGPEATLHLTYGAMERLTIANTELVDP